MEKNVLDLNRINSLEFKKSLIEFCFSKSKRLKVKYSLPEDWLQNFNEHIDNIKKKFNLDEIINNEFFSNETEWSFEKPINEIYCTLYSNEAKIGRNIICTLTFSLDDGKMIFKDVEVLNEE
jgi:hypothetical protein